MVAIAFVAESLSFVIEFLGCVMAIFYRIWARAVSTSWRGALHQLYTRGRLVPFAAGTIGMYTAVSQRLLLQPQQLRLLMKMTTQRSYGQAHS